MKMHKTFVHLQNTDEDIVNETWEISFPPLKVYSTKIEALKAIYMNQAVKSKSSEETKLVYIMNIFKLLLT